MSVSGCVMAFLLRALQGAIWSAPYLLAGLLISAALRGLVGGAVTRRLLGEGRWSGPPRAWLAGLLMPVSALGALPILAELRRSGVRAGSLAAFGVSVAAFHPLSLAYGASSLGLGKLGVFLLGSLVLATAVGWVVGAFDKCEGGAGADEQPPAPGADRLKAMGVDLARTLTGGLAIDLAVGLAGAGLLGALLSPEYLPPLLSARDPFAPAAMAAVAAPGLVMPEKAVMGAVEMSKLGMSPGAMFVLISAGAGFGLGTCSWLVRGWGWRRAGGVLGLGLAVMLAVAAGVDRAVAATGVEDLDTHVFDDQANPFWGHELSASLVDGRMRKVLDGALPGWPVAAAVIGAMAGAGVWLRHDRPGLTFESFAAKADPGRESPAPRGVPRGVLAGAGLLGTISLGAAALLAYFPAPEQVFPDLQVTYADVFSSVQSDPPEATLGHLDHLGRLAAKIGPGSALRGGGADAAASEKTRVFRREIDRLRQAVAGGRRDEAKRLAVELGRAYRACRAAYLGAG